MSTRVLIVDDSPTLRGLLKLILSREPDIEVVAEAESAQQARELIKQYDPHVVTLDIEMPGMDGLSFLERIMRLRPTPVIMCSAQTQNGAEAALRALELGAVDVVGKPGSSQQNDLEQMSIELISKIRIARHARVRAYVPKDGLDEPRKLASLSQQDRIIAIASSTGGPEAVQTVLKAMPSDAPPIVITQHMPRAFLPRFADRLARVTGLEVLCAEGGEVLQPGRVILAPGDRHLTFKRTQRRLLTVLDDSPPRYGHKPAADVMFESLARLRPGQVVGIILSGMGKDGANGAKLLHDKGCPIIAQEESSCVVFGMPKAAYDVGAVSHFTSLEQIAQSALSATLECRAA